METLKNIATNLSEHKDWKQITTIKNDVETLNSLFEMMDKELREDAKTKQDIREKETKKSVKTTENVAHWNDFDGYSTRKISNWSESKTIKIATNQSDVKKFIDYA